MLESDAADACGFSCSDTLKHRPKMIVVTSPLRSKPLNERNGLISTVRSLPEWRSKYFHLAMRRGRKIAKVAMARKLAIQLYWMLRKEQDYEQTKGFGPHAGQPEHRRGVQ